MLPKQREELLNISVRSYLLSHKDITSLLESQHDPSYSGCYLGIPVQKQRKLKVALRQVVERFYSCISWEREKQMYISMKSA